MEPISPPRHRLAVLRLVLPPLLAVALFAAAVAWLIIPATTAALMEGKRETLRAIVASAVSLCERHHAAESVGAITREQAQAQAAADLRALRYGDGSKDYLWVIDLACRMVAHPYRSDLEGRDLADYADPDGVRLFATSAALVRSAGEGFVAYRWQHQDDPQRIAPKLTYVRGFAPWGWVVGSGIYLDDVETETAHTARRLGWIAAGVGALVAALVALGLRQGWVSERLRQRAETELARSHERFQTLAHASSEAVWLVIDGRVAAANRRAAELAGGARSADGAPAADLLADHQDRDLVAGGAAGPRTALLAGAAGPLAALVTAEPVAVHGRGALVLSARPLDEHADEGDRERRAAAEAQNDAAATAQAGLLAPVAPLAEPVPVLPLTATPAEVIARLAADGGSAALLAAPDGGIAGIVTAGDLARRGGATAYAAMSAPVRWLDGDATLGAAADAMAGAGIGRLALESDGGARLVTAALLLDRLRQGPAALAAAAAGADQAALAAIRRRLEAWMASLARVRLDPELAAAEGTRVADAILRRCCELAAAELGPPPAPCAWLCVGSQGRCELLPGADQDSALVFADDADPRWFQAFASGVVARYQAAGWPRCRGGCHAADPRWCQPLGAWRERYAGWIRHAEPQALLESAVFFDARPAWGDGPLAAELAAAVRAEAAARPVFLLQLAQETLQARSPLGLFGGLRADAEGAIDLKLAMLHAAGFARVQALAHGVAATGTGARLRALAAAGRLPADTAAEAIDCWRFLLGLRLGARTRPGGGDRLDPATLGGWELAQLKRALAGIDGLRERLRADLARAGA